MYIRTLSPGSYRRELFLLPVARDAPSGTFPRQRTRYEGIKTKKKRHSAARFAGKQPYIYVARVCKRSFTRASDIYVRRLQKKEMYYTSLLPLPIGIRKKIREKIPLARRTLTTTRRTLTRPPGSPSETRAYIYKKCTNVCSPRTGVSRKYAARDGKRFFDSKKEVGARW